MIETLFLSASLAFINPADPSLSTIYPSGVKDADKKIFSAPPSSLSPILRIGTPLKCPDGYVVQPGCYLVKPSKDEKKLMFYEGTNLVFEATVIENIIVKTYKKNATAHTEIFENDKLIIIYQLGNIIKKTVLPIK